MKTATSPRPIVLTLADQRSPRMVAILRRKATAARVAGVPLDVELETTPHRRATLDWLERTADIGVGDHGVFLRGLEALARGDLHLAAP